MYTTELLKREQQISFVKEKFEKLLSEKLSLYKVSSPLAIIDGTGINDDLNGIERPVAFPVKALDERRAVVVHSLAKWKRLRLKELSIPQQHGIITDMRALRPDEDFTRIHSIYVDQWDWEKHILPVDRSLQYLKSTVESIYQVLYSTELAVQDIFPDIKAILPSKITFIHSEELLQRYPDLTPKQRENKITEEFGAVFIIGIGGDLSNGQAHDGRASDYDDWSSINSDGYKGLNGDILVWHPTLEQAFEISSMGIRVDREALLRQLEVRGDEKRKELFFHQQLLANELPQSIGGGIGQSRTCMFLLKKKHIGEVQIGIWEDDVKVKYQEEGVELL